MTAEWEPPGLSTWLGFASDSTAVLGRSSRCSGTRFVEPPSEATLTVYGCEGGRGTVELRAGSITGRLLDSITITVRAPTPTPTPPAVSNLVATASTTSERLTWDDLDGATKYRVEHRLSTSTGSWTPVDTTANVRNVANLTPETSYAFKIRAYGDGTTYKAAWGAEAATTASTVGIVPLAKPPAPGGLSASSSGENSVSVSWTALTGADKYEVQYRQGSSGNWSTYNNDITGTSPTVSGLQCETGYQFRVRAYGDGVSYRTDWGAWSSASTEVRTSTCPTPTPTPTPGSGGPSPTPSGTLSASPEKIAVGQSTTITATWNNVASTPKLSFGPQLAERCAGIQGQGVQGRSVLDTELVAKATQTLTGCTAGTVTVKLLDGSTELDAVTVAVVAKLNIEATRRIGYRWFNIGWTAARAYTSFGVEWRNEGEGESDWSELVQSGQSGARAIMSGMAAAIRGLPHKDDTAVEIVVVASGAGGLEGRSNTLRYARAEEPKASGHLRDHTMKYDMAELDTSPHTELAGWVKRVVPGYANRWANVVSSLQTCTGTCPRNRDGDVLTIRIDLGPICGTTRLGCVRGNPGKGEPGDVERLIGRSPRRMGIVRYPILEGPLRYRWTDNKALDGFTWTNDAGQDWAFAWTNSTVAHELGHGFGLSDRDGEDDYYGIMDGKQDVIGKKNDTISQDDKDALIAIYKAHTIYEGW